MRKAAVDGMDVLAVREVLAEAVERARKEDLPTLVEVRTYRFMGHSMSDPAHGSYRTREELAEHRRRDPIKRFTPLWSLLASSTRIILTTWIGKSTKWWIKRQHLRTE